MTTSDTILKVAEILREATAYACNTANGADSYKVAAALIPALSGVAETMTALRVLMEG